MTQNHQQALLIHEFFHALFQGNNRVIIDLLNQGVDINHIDEEASFLIIGCSFPKISLGVCKLLIKKGANVNYIDIKGNTALHYVDGLDKMKLLIQHKINLDTINLEGLTALELKLRQEKFNEAQYLIDIGANYELVNWNNLSESIREKFLLPIIAKKEKSQFEEILIKNHQNKKIKL